MLRENVAANALENVTVHAIALGARHEVRDLFVRGDVSAVNSLFPQSVYAEVTSVEQVAVEPLDDLVPGRADVVKIDVEGAELEVLGGMRRLLADAGIQLIVEWHPLLQEAAGHSADALPRFLLDQGFTLRAASHAGVTAFTAGDIDASSRRLRPSGTSTISSPAQPSDGATAPIRAP